MQPHVLRTPDAARYVGLAESTLEKMRIYGTGPVYQKAGAKIIVYRREDLDLWLESGRRKSTSDPGLGAGQLGAELDLSLRKGDPAMSIEAAFSSTLDCNAELGLSTAIYASLSRVIEFAPIENKLAVFGLMARTAAEDLAAFRQQMIDDLWLVASEIGLVTKFGTTSVQSVLAMAFGGSEA